MQKFFLICSLMSTASAHAYVYGYSRLYRPSNKVTVDLLYDFHAPNKLSADAMREMPISDSKKYLYQTERAVLETLESLNSSKEAHSIVLIWESCQGCTSNDSSFIGYADTYIFRRLKNLDYIHADQTRAHLEVACIHGKKVFWGMDPTYSFKGISFEVPVHLCKQRVRKIISRSGQSTWEKLKLLHSRAVRRFKSYGLEAFHEIITNDRDNFPLYWNHFLAFSALADVEMLSHILASSKKRIIVYCGGAHARNIKKFLCESAQFTCQYEHITTQGVRGRPEELELKNLSPLGKSV